MSTQRTTDPKARHILLAAPFDLEQALELRHLAKQYRQEREELESAIAEIGGKAEGEREARLAVAYWALGNREQAEAHAGRAKGAPGLFLQGLLAEEDGDAETALARYEAAAKEAPSSAPAVLRQVEALRRLGRADEALARVEKLDREFGDKADLHYYRARALEDAGRPEEALAAYEKAMDVDVAHAEAIYHAARLLDRRGDERAALRLYERIGPGQPATYINALLNLSLLYEDQGDYQAAADCCRRILNVAPNNRRARLFLRNAEASETMYYSPEESKETERVEGILRIPVSDFELSVRSRNCLQKMNIHCLGDLVKKTESEMLSYKNFGETSLREIKEMLTSKGLRLGMFREDAATRAAHERARRGQNRELLSKSIDELELGVRSRKAMDMLNIASIEDLVSMSETELANVKNFGRVSLNEIKKRLAEMGLSLKDSK